MDERKRVAILVVGVILGLALAAAWLLSVSDRFAHLSTAAKEMMARTLWKSVAFALATVAGLLLLPVAVPATWIAVAGAVVFVGTGGYEIVQTTTQILPQLRGGSPAGSLPDPCEVGPYTDASGVTHICTR